MIKSFEQLVIILKENGYDASFRVYQEDTNKYCLSFKLNNKVWNEILQLKNGERLKSDLEDSCVRLFNQILISSTTNQ